MPKKNIGKNEKQALNSGQMASYPQGHLALGRCGLHVVCSHTVRLSPGSYENPAGLNNLSTTMVSTVTSQQISCQ